MLSIGFDGDGTIVDSCSWSWRAAERILAGFGVAASISSPEGMDAAFGSAAQAALVGAEHCATLRQMHRLLMRRAAPEIGVFQEVVDVIAALPGTKTLVTAALSDGIATCLGGHARMFDRIVGFDHGRKPDLLARFASRFDLFVTDTGVDVEDCKALGIPVVACAWGYDSLPILAASKPDAIVQSPAELARHIHHFTKETSHDL